MAITQISRIQHRRGVSTELPQLASAELGWSIDNRRLYIGNGTLDEGAPSIGNTEILTEHSLVDLLSVAENYQFNGNVVGYSVQTGASPANPVYRTIQEKLDDIVNVRDFGAIGDGTTDDTGAINRALEELYTRDEAYTSEMVRRTLYIPAGSYLLDGDVMKIPSYATVVGDGMEHTIIIQTDGTQECVAKLVDSLGQSGNNIGQNGASVPKYINISGITFKSNSDAYVNSRVFKVEKADTVFFKNVRFTGSVPSTAISGNSSACLGLYCNATISTSNIFFNDCEFDHQIYGVVAADSGISNVLFSGSKFHDLYLGMNLGELASTPPKAVKVYASYFDDIYMSALSTHECYNVVSSFNYYGNIGTPGGTPTTPVITFAGDDCYSFGDTFERTDSEDLSSPRVQSTGNGAFVVIPHDSVRIGERKLGPGLLNAISSNAAVTVTTMTSTMYTASIKYSVIRDSYARTGTFVVTQRGATVEYTDDYTETGDVGVTLSANTSAGITTVWATKTSGSIAYFRHAVDSFLN